MDSHLYGMAHILSQYMQNQELGNGKGIYISFEVEVPEHTLLSTSL